MAALRGRVRDGPGLGGYELAVDPTTHEGPVVVKSVENSTHDGEGLFVEYRVPVAEGAAAFVRPVDGG